jgi:uncharacterized protein
MIRVVLDTNTLISGFFWGGIPWQVYTAALDEKYILLTSDALLAELSNVLQRPKFVPALNAIQKTAETIVNEHLLISESVIPIEVSAEIIRDPKDRIVLAAALGGKADFIVSGDKDLLVLQIFENIPIISASQFLIILEEK